MAEAGKADVIFGRDSRNLGMRVLKGTTLLVGTRLIVRSFSLINIVILARLLTPHDYGTAALAMAAIGAFAALSDLKLVTALTAIDKVEPAHLNSAFTLGLIRGLLLVGTVFVSADWIAAWMEAPALEDVLRVLSLIFLCSGLSNPAFWMYQRNLDFSKEFGRATLAQALASALTIASAFYFRSYWAIVVGTVVAAAANMILSYWRIDFRPRLGLRHWRQMISFGGWLTLEGLALQLNQLAPRLLIPKLLSPAALGLYTIGREAVSLPLDELVQPLRRTFFPSFSAIRNEPNRLRRTVRLAIATVLGITLPVGVGLSILSQQTLLVLVGDQWLAAAIILQVLAPVMAVLLSTSPVIGLTMAMGATRSLFLRTLGLATLAWINVYVGLTTYGFEGAIYGLAVNQLCALVVNLLFMRQFLGEPVWRFFADGWRSFVSAGAMALLLAWLLQDYDPARDAAAGSLATFLHMLPYVGAGALTYLTTHLLLWRLAGRPDGFEANVIHYLQVGFGGVRTRLRRRT